MQDSDAGEQPEQMQFSLTRANAEILFEETIPFCASLARRVLSQGPA
jgi:hypothetical protein